MTTPNVVEKPVSRELILGSQNKHTRECFIFNATSQEQAMASVLANTTIFPTLYATTQGGYTYTFLRGLATVKEVADASNQGPSTWDGTVEYQLLGFNSQPYQTGDNVTTFEIGFQAINTKYNPNEPGATGIYATSDAPIGGDNTKVPDFLGLIGVTKDAVEGTDVDYPTFTWSETFYIPDSDVTTAFINAVYNIANNPINDDTFRDFAAGEVKFGGMTGTRRYNGGDWELNFKFSASPNTTSLYIGDVGPITKYGWDYVWVKYTDQLETFGGLSYTIKVAGAAYVETLYPMSDFSALGIGT